MKLASGPAQRDIVYRTMAEEAYNSRQYKTAATAWAKIIGGRPGFEELVLQLVEGGDPEALQIFLETKLKVWRERREVERVKGTGQGGCDEVP